jgi:hypothetical protein
MFFISYKLSFPANTPSVAYRFAYVPLLFFYDGQLSKVRSKNFWMRNLADKRL